MQLNWVAMGSLLFWSCSKSIPPGAELPVGHPERDAFVRTQNLRAAVAAVTSGQFSLGLAAVMFKIKKSTLHDHVQAFQQGHSLGSRPGPKGNVALDDQLVMVRWAQLRDLLRFPVSAKQIRATAGQIAAKRGTPFKYGKASRRWFNAFAARWKHEFDMTKPSKLKSGQSALTAENLKEAYDIFERINAEYGLKSTDWWNFDEVGFDRVIGGRAKRAKSKSKTRCEFFMPFTDHVTIGAAIRADGARLPPFYIFSGSAGGDHSADIEAQLLKGTEETGAGITWTGNQACVWLSELLISCCRLRVDNKADVLRVHSVLRANHWRWR
jgi:hypothetical protein